MLAKDVMIREVVTATKDFSIHDCIELLFKRHIGSAVIVDELKRCIGIFTERDAIRVVAQKVPLTAPIEKVMTKHLITVNEDATFVEANRLIKLHDIRHLPVTDAQGVLVGLISVRHILYEFFEL